MSSLTSETMDKAKDLAPWRSSLPWWVMLIEGVVVGLVGILILFDPRQTTINVSLALAGALMIIGLVQIWGVFRDKVPDGAEEIVSAAGAIGVFTGLIILLLFFMGLLTAEAGVIIFGLGSLTFGLLEFLAAFNMGPQRRRTAFIQGIFFTLVGVLMLYVHFGGADAVQTATTLVGWLAIITGFILIGMSFMRRSNNKKMEEISDKAATSTPTEKDASPETAKTAPKTDAKTTAADTAPSAEKDDA